MQNELTASPANKITPTDPVSSQTLEILIQQSRAYPREIELCSKNAIKELELVPDLAERAYYSIPYKEGASRKMIEGLSIKAARSLELNWGHMATDKRVIGEDKSNYFVKGFCIDLENLIQNSAELKVSKFYKPKGSQSSVPWNGDMMRNQILSGQSKAVRNAILDTLPEWYKSVYFDRAKQLVIAPVNKGQITESLEARIEKGKSAICKEYKIPNDKLDDYLTEYFDGLDTESYLIQLKGLFNGLKEGAINSATILGLKPMKMPQSRSQK